MGHEGRIKSLCYGLELFVGSGVASAVHGHADVGQRKKEFRLVSLDARVAVPKPKPLVGTSVSQRLRFWERADRLR